MIMKKLLTLFVVCFAFAATSIAQDKALGIRFGGGAGYGGEASFQMGMGDANRLEADLGLSYGHMSLTGVYQWTWDLAALGDGFGWYAGVGAGLRLGNTTNNSIGLGIVGQIGIEYTLPSAPIQFSLDTRPGFFINNYGYGDYGAFSVRYVF
jgi:hypothetical protein